jgi:Nickel responsive protein SCO4226-like
VVFVVERYLPGLDQERLVGLLGNLGRVTQDLRAEGTAVRYLGSTIVPGDEACFCQFDGASEEAVAEANERAGVPFDRIVAAVAVPVTDDGS